MCEREEMGFSEMRRRSLVLPPPLLVSPFQLLSYVRVGVSILREEGEVKNFLLELLMPHPQLLLPKPFFQEQYNPCEIT